MATMIGLPRAIEVVQEGADVEEIRWVKGESEGWSEATRRVRALACPESCRCAL
jgi:hypothetical protein